jgi:hypothetical protein
MLVKTGGSPDQVCKHGQELDSAEQPGRSAEPGEMDSRAREKRDTPTPPPPGGEEEVQDHWILIVRRELRRLLTFFTC